MGLKKKAEVMKQVYDHAHECEFVHHGCSQCLILAIQEAFEMRDDNLFKAASGLAGGVGQMHDTCGALLGASLMLGFWFGRSRADIGSTEKLMNSLVPVGKLYQWFEKEYGSVKCRDIRVKTLGAYYDTKIPGQSELAQAAGLYKICADLVGRVAVKTAEMLWDAKEEKKQMFST